MGVKHHRQAAAPANLGGNLPGGVNILPMDDRVFALQAGQQLVPCNTTRARSLDAQDEGGRLSRQANNVELTWTGVQGVEGVWGVLRRNDRHSHSQWEKLARPCVDRRRYPCNPREIRGANKNDPLGENRLAHDCEYTTGSLLLSTAPLA